MHGLITCLVDLWVELADICQSMASHLPSESAMSASMSHTLQQAKIIEQCLNFSSAALHTLAECSQEVMEEHADHIDSMPDLGRDAIIDAGSAQRKASKRKQGKATKAAFMPDSIQGSFDNSGSNILLELVKAVCDVNQSLIVTQVGWDLNLSLPLRKS